MFETLLKCLLGMSVILCAWITLQQAWKKAMGVGVHQDALAGRLGCQGCHDGSACHGTAACVNKNVNE